jgi:hypothetical protein
LKSKLSRILAAIVAAAATVAAIAATVGNDAKQLQVCRTMQCVLRSQPAATSSPAPGPTSDGLSAHAITAAPSVVQGIDFGWSGVSAATARSIGAHFALSYISYDPSKDWTRSLVDSYHATGLATVATFESTATRAEQGCAAGAADARYTEGKLAALDAPAGQPFTMAIDFDANGPEVEPYFHCAQAAEPGLVNAYGGYRPLLYLYQHHDVGNLNFQTYAWSNGQWLPASIAPLEQWLNGSSYDHDRALLPVYGQWPAPVTKTHVNHHYKRYPATRRKLCHCSERGVARRYDRLRAKQTAHHHPHRAELKRLRHDSKLLADRIERVATRHSVGVWGPSPRWHVYHRAERYHGLRRRQHGGIVPRPAHHG